MHSDLGLRRESGNQLELISSIVQDSVDLALLLLLISISISVSVQRSCHVKV